MNQRRRCPRRRPLRWLLMLLLMIVLMLLLLLLLLMVVKHTRHRDKFGIIGKYLQKADKHMMISCHARVLPFHP